MRRAIAVWFVLMLHIVAWGEDLPGTCEVRFFGTSALHDFEDHTQWGAQARIFFSRKGFLESFPLPESKRRWVLNTCGYKPAPSLAEFCKGVLERTGHDLTGQRNYLLNPFQAQRYMASAFSRG